MRKSYLPILIFAFFILFTGFNSYTIWDSGFSTPLLATQKVEISEIKANPDRYHNQYVSVEGYVENVKQKVSKRGNPYTTFLITDKKGNSLKVFIWGWEDISEGDKVRVEGIFQKVKYVSGYTFYNEISAKGIKKLK
ncbi:hypothetical protein [Caldisericum sp.]|uniref:hypothetical protein n=1 Tax=Caldisericum sp. TaxID=2499687 RepID=UPI003D0AE81C